MEIISRKNEHFFLAITYKYEDDEVLKPVMAFLPMEALKNRRTFEDKADHDKLLNQIWAKVVDVVSVTELEKLMDQEEQRLLNTVNQKNEGVGA